MAKNAGYIMELPVNGEAVVRINAPAPTLEECQKFVGGYIEIQRVKFNGEDGQMILNEEGKLHGLDVNLPATEIFRNTYPMTDDYIVGPVLVLTGNSKVE